jgi:hypothetical protein
MKLDEEILKRYLDKYLVFIASDSLRNPLFTEIEKSYKAGLEKAEEDFDMNFMPDLTAINYMQEMAFTQLKGVIDGMKNKLQADVQQMVIEQLPLSTIKERIKEIVDVYIARANSVMTTESTRAYNIGAHQGALNTGLKLKKEWVTQPYKNPNSPCPVCKSMDGKSVMLYEHFVDKDGKQHLSPPIHPNCRCRIVYHA